MPCCIGHCYLTLVVKLANFKLEDWTKNYTSPETCFQLLTWKLDPVWTYGIVPKHPARWADPDIGPTLICQADTFLSSFSEIVFCPYSGEQIFVEKAE